MSLQWEHVAGPFSRLTEGPAWDGRRLLFTYIPASRIMAYDPGDRGLQRVPREHQPYQRPGLRRRRAVVRLLLRRAFHRPVRAGRLHHHHRGQPQRAELNTPNDLAIDRQGRIWFSNPWNAGNIDPSEQPEMEGRDILRADPQPDGSYTCQQVTFDTTGVNGILVSPDEKSLYIIQTDAEPGGVRELRSYPINDDGSLGQYIVLHQFGNATAAPSGASTALCLDSEGNIVGTAGNYVSGPGPMIYVWSPRGRVLDTYPMPTGVDGPTNCAYGDADQRQPLCHHHPGPPHPSPQHRAPGLDNVAPRCGRRGWRKAGRRYCRGAPCGRPGDLPWNNP